MRIVTWNCNMALHRKFDAVRALKPDIAVICECAEPDRLQARGLDLTDSCDPVWIGQNPDKGLAVFAFNGYRAARADPYHPTLRYIAPVQITGPVECNLLAVWAQNLSGGISRKRQSGPLRRSLSKYRSFLSTRPALIAGDLNNNVIWDRPGWRINHGVAVSMLASIGLVSVYHTVLGEEQGCETMPTIYWRDRKKDGPTYHLDYVFVPGPWIERVTEMTVGSYEDWCGSGLSDHVPVVVDVAV